MLTITNKIKTYLGSQDESILLKKSNAAREMMRKKMERIVALQQNIKIHKEQSIGGAQSSSSNNTTQSMDK